MMTTTKRTGALGALMDEYERAAIDLKEILLKLSDEDFKKIRDHKTEDQDCRSIQSINFHLVQSGYTYANYLNSVFEGEWNEYKSEINKASQGITEIDKMLAFTDQVLSDKYQLPSSQIEAWSFKARWGVTYDAEQLLEHAIVHILRHRRQIENFLNQDT